ncbi:TNF receptor-associated factor 3-like isoform X2 [Xenia sp. Carnegie-2017]|uniref:TNF receptor-associated factor 3-like isoform X1 n=1 Tax=Xenia sp. Carnegie-2017 TaxID=2897299 RepID=UPI001F033700|nr:TNF receptor-associated factor 3-like isoform X1 [Xenia sp. Carnegie-2017]XP_046842167.1 TNF receptor-associated factor 3-like isoform X2 [Xenia sp. Carnegie-2017]
MACSPNVYESGYEESRIKTAVDENFYCSICLNVMKDARMCHNQHNFCRKCIEEHLRVNPQRCPQCQDDLTVATLHPARFINNVISKLKINCDYASRGCPEFINVEYLERHVQNCDFAPVLCSNERCGLEINKRDKIKHETELCEYRKIASHDFREISEMFQRSFENKMEMQMSNLSRKIDEKFIEVKESVKTLTSQYKKMMKSRREVENVQQNLAIVTKEKMESRKEIKDVQQNLSAVIKEMMELKKEMKDNQQNLATLTNEMKEIKTVIFQMLEKMNINEPHVQTLTSPVEMVMNSVKGDIFIAGSYSRDSSKSVEIFLWMEEKWFEIASMENEHCAASSFVYNDNLFVVGGFRCKSMETLNIKQSPLTWRKFSTELPYGCCGHQTVVCKQQILLIGGYIFGKGQSDLITEINITGKTSHVVKELCHMPEPRRGHGALVVDDKVLIFGGYGKHTKVLSSVLEFDPRTLTFKKMPPLPHPLTEMATVQWRDQVVLLGGCDDEREKLNSVIMYDIKTGKITVLPSML